MADVMIVAALFITRRFYSRIIKTSKSHFDIEIIMNAEAEESKKLGNDCMKADKFFEAILHYTKSIKLQADNPPFYSNRSLAFLKIQQYNYALEDAKTVIKLMPKWTKGYFRRGEVEFLTEHYEAAMESYKMAAELDPQDAALKSAFTKAEVAHKKQNKDESRIPYIGAAIGLLIGLLIVLGDLYLAQSPIMQNENLQMMLVVAFTSVCYGCAWIYRYISIAQRSSLLDPPMDILNDNTNNTPGMPGAEIPSKKNAKRGSARQRQKQKS